MKNLVSKYTMSHELRVIFVVLLTILTTFSGRFAAAADNPAKTSNLPGTDASESSADLEYGEYLVSDCTSCHSLHVDRGSIVALAGLPNSYLIQTLESYRADERENQAMTTVAKSLTDEDIQAIAAYLVTVPPKEPE